MRATLRVHQGIEADIDHCTETFLPPLQHQWPLLGKELFALERTLTNPPGKDHPPLSEQEKRERREAIRNGILAQLYREEETHSLDKRYLAFLLLKQGRGGAIVGDPSALGERIKKQELPYTGLEGYYAGSERTPERPGMTPEEMLQEEANIGAALLQSIKKRCIEQNTWTDFARLKHVLAGGQPDREELRDIQLYWGMIVRRLHVRIYHNPEFALTLTEQMERLKQLLSYIPGRSEEERRSRRALQGEYTRLKQERERMSEAEQERERQERRARERIRTDRLAEYHRFREETYHLLSGASQGSYAVEVRDTSLEEATIVETIPLPAIAGRHTYPAVDVHVTAGQLEGYLFLAQLGAIGGDPLTRSVLVSP